MRLLSFTTMSCAIVLLATSVVQTFGLLPTANAATTNTAEQIIQRSWQLYRQHTPAEQEQITLQTTKDGEATREKTLLRWTRYQTSSEQVVIKFDTPAADAGLALLIDRSDRSQQQMWLRMPSWIKARRVQGQRQAQYFAGTDFTFEDNAELSGEATERYNYRLLDESKNGWWIEAIAKNPSDSAYGRREIWLDRDYAITRIDYFDRNLSLIKTLQNIELKKFPSGGWRPDLMEMRNQQETRLTVLKVQARQFDSNLASQIFSQEFLGD
jgi:hypothetical protein